MLKKITIMLSLTLFIALFVACSQDSSNSGEETTVVEEVAVADTEVEAAEKISEPASDEATEPVAQPESVAISTDLSHPTIHALLNQMPLVQHHYDPGTNSDSFTCVGNGGLNSVKINPEGPIYVGPDSGDISLRGVNLVFEIDPSGEILAAPMGRESILINQANEEVFRIPLDEVLTAFTTEEAVWTGSFDDPGRGNCLKSFQ